MGHFKEKKQNEEEKVIDLWRDETNPEEFRSRSHKIPPPDVHLPCFSIYIYIF